MLLRRQIKKMIASKQAPKEMLKLEHHSGKGTRARLNTIAEKNFFRSKQSI